ncbi:MAG: hypothetical protein Q8P03_00200 [bacterium]|nr:hypothetical protein [bacterium]
MRLSNLPLSPIREEGDRTIFFGDEESSSSWFFRNRQAIAQLPTEQQMEGWRKIFRNIQVHRKVPIDPELEGVLVAMNILGFTTSYSCFGHKEQLFSYPHISFGVLIHDAIEATGVSLPADEVPWIHHQYINYRAGNARMVTGKERTSTHDYKEREKPFFERWEEMERQQKAALADLLAEFYNHRKLPAPKEAILILTGQTIRPAVRPWEHGPAIELLRQFGSAFYDAFLDYRRGWTPWKDLPRLEKLLQVRRRKHLDEVLLPFLEASQGEVVAFGDFLIQRHYDKSSG